MNPISKQSQGRVDNSYLDDFLDSSISDAGDSDDDSFACDEEEAAKDNAEYEVNTACQDKGKRSGMMGRIKGMVKQSSVRSLFSNGSTLHEEFESDHSHSDNEDNQVATNKSEVITQKNPPKRPGLVKARSMRGLFNNKSGGDEKDPETVDKQEAPKRPGLLKARSVRNVFNKNGYSKQEPEEEINDEPPKRPGLLKSSSMGNLFSSNGNSPAPRPSRPCRK